MMAQSRHSDDERLVVRAAARQRPRMVHFELSRETLAAREHRRPALPESRVCPDAPTSRACARDGGGSSDRLAEHRAENPATAPPRVPTRRQNERGRDIVARGVVGAALRQPHIARRITLDFRDRKRRTQQRPRLGRNRERTIERHAPTRAYVFAAIRPTLDTRDDGHPTAYRVEQLRISEPVAHDHRWPPRQTRSTSALTRGTRRSPSLVNTPDAARRSYVPRGTRSRFSWSSILGVPGATAKHSQRPLG